VHVAGPAGGRPKAKPPVRKLAKDLGVDRALAY
jgi:pyruvate dehydrogenase E2 component (dihydrolipoamide acetyltransferase)